MHYGWQGCKKDRKEENGQAFHLIQLNSVWKRRAFFLHRAGREKKIAQQVVGAQSCMSHKVCMCVCVYACVYFGDPVTSGALQVCASA